MKDLGNKTMIFLLCAALLPTLSNDIITSAAFVSTITVACLGSFFETKRPYYFLCIPYSIAALLSRPFSLFLPVLLYDASGGATGSNISLLFVLAAVLGSLHRLTPAVRFYLLIFSAVSYLLQYYSRKTDTLLTQFHRYRDTSTESSLFLKEKNEALAARQDYEVHVAILSERNRIAREIHDNVGHMLTRSLLQTGALQVINKDETLSQPIQQLHDTLNTAMTSIRNSVHDLHDDAIHLESVIRDIIKQTETLHVTLDYKIETEVPKKIKYAFIAIVREALHNVEKHSDADRVHIIIKEHPALYQLLIEDNGSCSNLKNYRADEYAGAGIGLANMRERIQSLGGNINFTAENGFRIFISLLKKM